MIESEPTTASLGRSAWLPLPCVLAALVAMALLSPLTATAQTFQVLYSFSHSAVGINPMAGVTMDRVGNLYGTASVNGSLGLGTVYKMSKHNGNWTVSPLHDFGGGSDGAFPEARVVFGPDGALYGTTAEGGSNQCHSNGCGIVFRLAPPPTSCGSFLCSWTETVLYRFQGSVDGSVPGYGDLVFDGSGAIYGTTSQGGAYGYGTVFKLTKYDGGWTESVLYSFTGNADGYDPEGGVVFDAYGNLFGTSEVGVFELSPSGSGWTFSELHTFQYQTDGLGSESGVVFDAAGNLYGDTETLGPGEGGTVYQMSPSGQGWTFQVLHPFDGGNGSVGSAFMVDSSGNVYAARVVTAGGYGEVFEMTPSGGSWNYTQLHQFMGGQYDGLAPYGGVVMDASGNLYGTTYSGGYSNFGVVYEITP